MSVKYLKSVLNRKLQVLPNHKVNFVPKTSAKVSIAETSNEIKGYKVSCVLKSNTKIQVKELQVFLNLPKT